MQNCLDICVKFHANYQIALIVSDTLPCALIVVRFCHALTSFEDWRENRCAAFARLVDAHLWPNIKLEQAQNDIDDFAE